MTQSTASKTTAEDIKDLVLASLKSSTPGTEEFAELLNQLEKINDITYADNKAAEKPKIAPEAVLGSLTNLAGILAILGFEHSHVLTSKALSFVAKTRS